MRNPAHKHTPTIRPPLLASRALIVAARHKQRGLSLMEFMVAMAIGLMTVAVATSALVVTHQISGTVNHTTQMQNQASYAFRVIGTQLRQAGAARLKLAMGTSKRDAIDAISHMDKVGLLIDGYSPTVTPVSGTADTLTVRYLNYAGKKLKNINTPAETDHEPDAFLRDCLGDGAGVDGGPTGTGEATSSVLHSTFELVNNELRCTGVAGTGQAIISDVNAFKVKYYVQDKSGLEHKIRIVDAAAVTNWSKVYAVEVCLDLVSPGPVHTPAGTEYTNCDGVATALNDRMHLVLRNTYQIRAQGLMTY
jgi:type IV pilus assembly protein PilW